MIARNTTSPVPNVVIKERFRSRPHRDAMSSAAIVSVRIIRIPAANFADAEDTDQDKSKGRALSGF